MYLCMYTHQKSCTRIFSCTIDTNYKLETTQIPIDSWIDCGLVTQWNTTQQWKWTVYNHTQPSHKQNVQWKKPDTKEHLLYESYLQNRKKGLVTGSGHEGASGVLTVLGLVIRVLVTEHALLVKFQQATWNVHLTLCIIYFNKKCLK